ncbi:MAG: DinB family protein [Pirellulaceae bacterium]
MTALNDHIVSFVQWIPWADRRICSSLGQCLDARASALPIFSHLLAAEHIWLSRINSLGQLVVWPSLTWDECLSWLEENEASFGRLLDSLTSNKVDRVIDYCDSKGSANSIAFIDILFHVGSHGAYHRGQIAKLIGSVGGQVPNTDYFVFVREIRLGP